MSLTQSMNISTASLINNQYALTVVSHNIANVNTEGYIRQGVEFQESRYSYGENNVIGTIKGLNGSTISELTDYMDKGALDDVINTNSDAEYYNTLVDDLNGLEGIVDALGDDGLNSLLNDFYTSVSNLEQYPDDISIRQQFVISAENLTDKFNSISKSIDDKEADEVESVDNSISTMNSLLSQLADANMQYLKSDRSVNDKNQINSILEELSSYSNVAYDTNANGTVNFYIGDIQVVQGGNQAYALNAKSEDGKYSLYLQSTKDEDYKIETGVTESVTSGQLAAQLETLNGTGKYISISDLREKVDSAAKDFASEVNKIQTYSNGSVFAANITADGSGNLLLEQSTELLFTTSDSGTEINAGNISVNSAIKDDPWLVAAARIDTSKYEDDSWKKAVGNPDNAIELSDLQNKKICSYSEENDTTLSKFLSSLSTDIGTNINAAQSKADSANDIADSAATNLSNIIGVNLDEELTDLIKYQRSYEASAKVFSTVNDLYDYVLNMI